MPYIRKKKWDRMEGLLQEIRQLLEQPNVSRKLDDAKVHVQIETLHMHEVKLDDLSFRLDQISIDDLSGSFNLGNNFLQAKESSKKVRNEQKDTFERSDADGFERSATGFRFKLKP